MVRSQRIGNRGPRWGSFVPEAHPIHVLGVLDRRLQRDGRGGDRNRAVRDLERGYVRGRDGIPHNEAEVLIHAGEI